MALDRVAFSGKDQDGWVLVLDPPALPAPPPSRRILGLTLPLRLALTAQAAGARAVLVSEAAADQGLALELVDPRLRIPVRTTRERSAGLAPHTTGVSVHCAANLVVHRTAFDSMGATALSGEIRLPSIDRKCRTEDAPRVFGWFEPIAVTSPRSARLAERALLRSLRKAQDGWTSTYLNRHVSLFLTRWLVATPLKPNQVSLAILCVGLAGAWLASRGTYGSMLAGAALFQAQSILDGCDGEMSRLTFRGSRAGEWLDTIGDDLTNYGFFTGAAWGLYAASGRALYLALGALTVACGLVGSAIEYRYLIRIGSGDLLKYPLGIGKSKRAGEAGRGLGRILDGISPLFKRDSFVLLTLIGAGAGLLGPFLAVFAAGAVGVLSAVLGAELRMERERRLTRPAAPTKKVHRT